MVHTNRIHHVNVMVDDLAAAGFLDLETHRRVLALVFRNQFSGLVPHL